MEAGWVPPPQRPRGSGTAPPPRATLYSLDSAMASSGGALPTVNEHPGGRRKSPEEARGSPRGLDAAAAEMAVRRGKNRFMKGGAPFDGSPPPALPVDLGEQGDTPGAVETLNTDLQSWERPGSNLETVLTTSPLFCNLQHCEVHTCSAAAAHPRALVSSPSMEGSPSYEGSRV